jgi:sugar transferase (PEP-CTERM/EpsH1 system associated)
VRILTIVERLPFPPQSGTPIRMYNLLRRAARAHEIWLLSFTRPGDQAADVAALREFCREVHTVPARPSRATDQPLTFLRYLLRGIPPDLRLYHSEALVERIRAVTARVPFDAVEIVDSYMARYLETLPQPLRARSLLTFIDVVSQRYERLWRLEPRRGRRLRLRLYARTMRGWEPRYAAGFARCLTMSETDRDQLLAANPRLRVRVVPNGVDAKAYRPLPPPGGPPALLFVGNMDAWPNVDAVEFFSRQVLPALRAAIPGLTLWIVGRDPRPEVRRLAGDGVRVTGAVDDVRPYYRRSRVAIVPLRAGGGTRLKILEAMALGRPVVATSIGCEGLAVVDGRHLVVRDTVAGLTDGTRRLFTHDAEWQRLVEAGRDLVTERYDWDVIARQLLAAYEEVAREGRTCDASRLAMSA